MITDVSTIRKNNKFASTSLPKPQIFRDQFLRHANEPSSTQRRNKNTIQIIWNAINSKLHKNTIFNYCLLHYYYIICIFVTRNNKVKEI